MTDYESMTSAQLEAHLEAGRRDHEAALVKMAEEYDALGKSVAILKDGAPRYTVELVVRSADGKKKESFASGEPVSQEAVDGVISALANQARAYVEAPRKRLATVQAARSEIARKIQVAKEGHYRHELQIRRAIEKAREREAQANAKRLDVAKHPGRPPAVRSMKQQLRVSGDIA